jgi:glyoxylase-like metal-dependent hydrolase (beta-lactamase superfamily II)
MTDTPAVVGKKKVEQVVLTHRHYDHASLLFAIREAFRSSHRFGKWSWRTGRDKEVKI